jgi:hypothetical protein
MAIDARHRNKNGEIGRKHGKTPIHILRRHYGPSFAKGCGCREKLGNLLEGLDELSLSYLVSDYEGGKLEQICRG